MVLRRQTLAAFLLLMPALVLAATKMYDVVPYRNCVAQARPDEEISQTFINVVDDELTLASLWVADADTHRYHVDVVDSAMPAVRVAYGDANAMNGFCGWLNFDLSPDEPLMRGRTYRAVFNRPGGSPITFSYCDTNPYKYGCLSVGSTPDSMKDLACRITGTSRQVDAAYWAFNLTPVNMVPTAKRNAVKDGIHAAGVGTVRTDIPWDWVQGGWVGQPFNFGSLDTLVYFAHDTLGCEVIGLLSYCTKWGFRGHIT